MTVSYIAGVYHIAPAQLLDGLGLPPGSDAAVTLKSAAEQSGASPYQYVQRAQRIIAAQRPTSAANGTTEAPGWLRTIGDSIVLGTVYAALDAGQ